MSAPRVVPAHAWRRQTWRAIPTIPTPAPETWLHHGASGSPSLATLLAYERYHVVNLGWRALGYSWAITGDGTVYEGRGWGRAGGHTSGHNLVSHGILLVGDWSRGTVPDAMVRSVAWLVRDGHRRGMCRLALTGGHRQAPLSISTECPGNAGMAALPRIRALLTVTIPPPERTWFDMASEADLRRVVREELGRVSLIRGWSRHFAGVAEGASQTFINAIRSVVREEVQRVGGSGGVDVNTLADRVVDRIKARL